MSLKKLDATEIKYVSQSMMRAFRRWRMLPISGNEFIVLDAPNTVGQPSPIDGEDAPIWRFDNKIAADRFRNEKIIDDVMVAVVDVLENRP